MIFDGKNLKKTYLHYLFAGIGQRRYRFHLFYRRCDYGGTVRGIQRHGGSVRRHAYLDDYFKPRAFVRRWRRLADVQGAGRRERAAR